MIGLSRSDLLDKERLAEIKHELTEVSGQAVFPISAPLGEGIEPLLNAIIQRLGSDEIVEDEDEVAADDRPWSPL